MGNSGHLKTTGRNLAGDVLHAKHSISSRMSSFRRVCAMACVDDGYIGDDEIEALKRLGCESYKLAAKQVDEVIEECNTGSADNEYLFYEVPIEIDEIAVDLYNIIRIIYADKMISENEKEAFNVMLILYGFRNTMFHKRIFDRIRLAFEDNEDNCEYDVRNDIELKNYLSSCLRRSGYYYVDERRGVLADTLLRLRCSMRSVIDKKVVKLIVDKFKYRKIKGPMLMGAKNFLVYGVNEYKYMRDNRNSFLTKLAILVFLLSASVLYIGTAFPESMASWPLFDREVYFAGGIISLLLSIEWIIFMKERMFENLKADKEETESKNMTKMLVVLVMVAVIIDMSFGMLELGGEGITNIPEVVIKFCSAIFLGGLCFYVGKCLELYNDHIEQDNRYMNHKIEELKGVARKMSEGKE